jgi:hypothetical protein
VEICVAAHFGRGGTTDAGLLARSGLLACFGLRASGLLAVQVTVGFTGQFTLLSGLLASSRCCRVYWPAPVYWPDGLVGHGNSTEPTHLGLLAVSVGRLPSGAPSLTDAPVGRVLRCACHTLQQIET